MPCYFKLVGALLSVVYLNQGDASIYSIRFVNLIRGSAVYSTGAASSLLELLQLAYHLLLS